MTFYLQQDNMKQKPLELKLKIIIITGHKTSHYVINQPNIIIQLQMVCVEESEANQ